MSSEKVTKTLRLHPRTAARLEYEAEKANNSFSEYMRAAIAELPEFQAVTSMNQVAADVEAVRDIVEELYEEFPVIARRFEMADKSRKRAIRTQLAEDRILEGFLVEDEPELTEVVCQYVCQLPTADVQDLAIAVLSYLLKRLIKRRETDFSEDIKSLLEDELPREVNVELYSYYLCGPILCWMWVNDYAELNIIEGDLQISHGVKFA